jgi:hypothetical protein
MTFSIRVKDPDHKKVKKSRFSEVFHWDLFRTTILETDTLSNYTCQYQCQLRFTLREKLRLSLRLSPSLLSLPKLGQTCEPELVWKLNTAGFGKIRQAYVLNNIYCISK